MQMPGVWGPAAPQPVGLGRGGPQQKARGSWGGSPRLYVHVQDSRSLIFTDEDIMFLVDVVSSWGSLHGGMVRARRARQLVGVIVARVHTFIHVVFK